MLQRHVHPIGVLCHRHLHHVPGNLQSWVYAYHFRPKCREVQLLPQRLQPTAMNPIWSSPVYLQERASQRGYAYDEVTPCIVEVKDGMILVDVDHPAYPLHPKPGFHEKATAALRAESEARQAALDKERGAKGPGTELKRMLRMVGITATPNCSCNARAEEMDTQGCLWCLKNTDKIVGWLKEEADKRQLPFSHAGARALVYAAVARAGAKSTVRKLIPGKKGKADAKS